VPGVIGTAEVLGTLVPDAPVRAVVPLRMAAE
jgi:phytoene desaturase